MLGQYHQVTLYKYPLLILQQNQIAIRINAIKQNSFKPNIPLISDKYI